MPLGIVPTGAAATPGAPGSVVPATGTATPSTAGVVVAPADPASTTVAAPGAVTPVNPATPRTVITAADDLLTIAAALNGSQKTTLRGELGLPSNLATLNTAQTHTALQTHTADIRLLNDPTDPNSVLPKRKVSNFITSGAMNSACNNIYLSENNTLSAPKSVKIAEIRGMKVTNKNCVCVIKSTSAQPSYLVTERHTFAFPEINGVSGKLDYTFILTEVGVVSSADEHLAGSVAGDWYVKGYSGGTEIADITWTSGNMVFGWTVAKNKVALVGRYASEVCQVFIKHQTSGVGLLCVGYVKLKNKVSAGYRTVTHLTPVNLTNFITVIYDDRVTPTAVLCFTSGAWSSSASQLALKIEHLCNSNETSTLFEIADYS